MRSRGSLTRPRACLPENALIDLMIAAEAAFLEEKIELSYRLSLRLACFLVTEPLEREKLRAATQGHYDLRSSIVHGSLKESERARLGAASADFEGIMRRALRKAITDGLPSPKELDRSIFSST